MNKPKPGQIWERDGRQRIVEAVRDVTQATYEVLWQSNQGGLRTTWTWCWAWEEWARKAKLVENPK